MASHRKTGQKTHFPARLAIFLLCLAWAFVFVKIPNFTMLPPSQKYPEHVREYLKDLRKKYSGTQRTLSVAETRAAISEACAFIAAAKKIQGIYDTPDAQELMFGTACTESGLKPRYQDGGGDAIGLFQVEYLTFRDLWDRAIPVKHPELYAAMKRTFSRNPNGEIMFEQLQQDDEICAIFARMKYAESSKPIPPAKNETAQAEYYKKYYNTHLGKASSKGFVEAKRAALKQEK